MKTEEVLTTQARQLMEVANTATKDVTKLHDTITRRKEHDQGNREACKKLDVNMNSHLSAMDNNLQAYTSTFSGHVVTLIEKLSMTINSTRLKLHKEINRFFHRFFCRFEHSSKQNGLRIAHHQHKTID